MPKETPPTKTLRHAFGVDGTRKRVNPQATSTALKKRVGTDREPCMTRSDEPPSVASFDKKAVVAVRFALPHASRPSR